VIDLESHETAVLLNPRLPAVEVEETRRRVERARAPEGLVWLATSGSRGPGKLVGLRREALLASAAAVNTHLGAGADDTWLLALPTFHVGGLGILARAHLSGARAVEPFGDDGWSAARFLGAARTEDCRLSALVPTQLFDLVEHGERCPESLRAIVIGGGRLDGTLYDRARGLGYPVLPSYGLTECASQVATAAPDAGPDLRILDHVDVRVADSGRFELRSPSLLEGYLHLTPEGDLFHDPKSRGWFETEDRGEIDRGALRIHGRDGSFVKVGGESVLLDRLEAILEAARRRHAPESDAALIADENARLGRCVALVVPRDLREPAVSALRDAFDAEVLPFERIRRVHRVERIPRSPLGKLRLAELRALL